MPDITQGHVSIDRGPGLRPGAESACIKAVITRGWNAYLVQIALIKDGEERQLVGKEVASYAVAETLARACAERHGVSWAKVEMVSI